MREKLLLFTVLICLLLFFTEALFCQIDRWPTIYGGDIMVVKPQEGLTYGAAIDESPSRRYDSSTGKSGKPDIDRVSGGVRYKPTRRAFGALDGAPSKLNVGTTGVPTYGTLIETVECRNRRGSDLQSSPLSNRQVVHHLWWVYDGCQAPSELDPPNSLDQLVVEDSDSALIDTAAVSHTKKKLKDAGLTTGDELQQPLHGPMTHRQRLLDILQPQFNSPVSSLNQPQISSWFDYDPMLFRSYQGPWGEPESVYPLGFSSAYLSRCNDLFGDASFAHPIPTPGSEELIRADHCDNYYFATPALSGVFSPFGRPFLIYQQLPNKDVDSAVGRIQVTRGRGGYANTTVKFANDFGSVGDVNFDATFLKYDGLRQSAETKLDRVRIITSPQISRRLKSRIGLFFNRLDLDKHFFPPAYSYKGMFLDDYSGFASEFEYLSSERTSYGLNLSFRRDDQKFDHESLETIQNRQIYDINLHSIHLAGRHHLQGDVDIRYLDMKSGDCEVRPVYFRLSAGDAVSATDKITFLGNLSFSGSTDLTTKPSVTLLVNYAVDSSRQLTIIAARSVILPQSDMQYYPQVSRSIQSEIMDYRLSGNEEIESGTINSVEAHFSYTKKSVRFQGRGGYTYFSEVPDWQVDYGELEYGDYSVKAVSRNHLYMNGSIHLLLPYRSFLDAAYGFRNVYRDGRRLTLGPEHIASGFGGFKLMIPKIKVLASAALGAKYRSSTTAYFTGGAEDSQLLLESYVSFDLKRFHFFYNFTNLLNAEYSMNGLLQPGRSHWWGFTWELYN